MSDVADIILNYLDGVDTVGNAVEVTVTNVPGEQNSEVLVFALCGQSNMSGRGIPEKEDMTAHSRVKKWKDGKLEVAIESIHGFDGRGEGVGPGLAFGKFLASRLQGATIVLVPTAVGSTNLAKWAPGKDLYNNAISQTKQALENIPNAKLAGVLWAQGESDSSSSKTAKKYGRKFAELIASFNKDVGVEVPWVAAELCDGLDKCTAMKATHWRKVNEGIRSCNVTVVPTAGFTTIDTLHYDSKSQREFGKRFAEAWLNLQ